MVSEATAMDTHVRHRRSVADVTGTGLSEPCSAVSSAGALSLARPGDDRGECDRHSRSLNSRYDVRWRVVRRCVCLGCSLW